MPDAKKPSPRIREVQVLGNRTLSMKMIPVKAPIHRIPIEPIRNKKSIMTQQQPIQYFE
jgi:hypothetical protein